MMNFELEAWGGKQGDNLPIVESCIGAVEGV